MISTTIKTTLPPHTETTYNNRPVANEKLDTSAGLVGHLIAIKRELGQKLYGKTYDETLEYLDKSTTISTTIYKE